MNSVHKHGTNSQIFLVGGGERWLKEQAIRTNTSISAFAASRIRAEMNRSLDVFSSPASEGSSPVLNISGYRPHTLEADPGQDHLSSHGPAPLLRDSSFGPVDIRERLKPIRR
ncbi:hypothetical protein BASA61_009804 [Batrachochytrium salamandrivorans]|nr:hypothetical protein BASA61_009804 [Batrachochytrium salamandrivorans]